jgi:ubiquinone/menaquinone biosynthesis C-methylase UbiE
VSHQISVETYRGNAAENYERYFVPAIGAPLASDLIDAASLRPGERVLDVACGTGVVTRLAAGHVGAAGNVSGVDINPGMLAVARENAPAASSIEWYEGSAEALPFADATFDVVLCQMGLQFFPDKPKALQEMRRVLTPRRACTRQRARSGAAAVCRPRARACESPRPRCGRLRAYGVLAARRS